MIVGDCAGNVYSVRNALLPDPQQETHDRQELSPLRLDDADHMSHITCLSFDPIDGSKLVTASRDCKVCLFVHTEGQDSHTDHPTPEYRFQSYVCRTESGMPVNHVEFNSAANKICVASNEDFVRIVEIDICGKVVKEMRVDNAHEGGCLQAVFHPTRDQYLATLGADKNVKIWDLSSQSPKCVKTLYGMASKEVVRMWLRATAEDDLLPMKLLQWTPDGKYLAILCCGDANDPSYSISFLSVDTWRESTTPEHLIYKKLLLDSKNPYMIRFSPNGVYLAVVDMKQLRVFDHEYLSRSVESRSEGQLVASIDMGRHLVSSFQWCSFADIIIACNVQGQCVRLSNFLPATNDTPVVNSYSASHSKALLKASMEGLEEDNFFADEDHSSKEDEYRAVEKDNFENLSEKKKNSSETKTRPKVSDFLADEAESDGEEMETTEAEDEDDDMEIPQSDNDNDSSKSLDEIKSYYRSTKNPSNTNGSTQHSISSSLSLPLSMFREYEPFQPGSTPFDTENRRILAWNNTGAIVCTRLGGIASKQQSIEIDFNDLSKQAIRITDRDDLSMAALNDNGAVFAAKCNVLSRPSIKPSFIRFQPFRTRAQTNLSDAAWQYSLPTGEDVECVTMVKEYVVVATSTAMQRSGISMHKHTLRVFNIAGVQHFTYSLPAPVVSIVGHDMIEDEHKCRLFVIMQDGFTMLSPTMTKPNLIYTVLELSHKHQYSARVVDGRASQNSLPITDGSRLRWIGFTQLGLLATVDTANIVRVLSPDWQGWMEVLDLTHAFRSAHIGEVSFYVSSITDKHVMFYPCKNPNAIPPIVPRPVMDITEFNVDMLPSTPLHEHEKKYVIQSMILNQKKRMQIERGQEPERDRTLGREERELDKTTLSMVFEAIEGELPEQALALCRQFRTQKAIAISKQPAEEKKLFALVKRIGEVEKSLFGKENQKILVPNTRYPVESKTVVVKETVVEKIIEKRDKTEPQSEPLSLVINDSSSQHHHSSTAVPLLANDVVDGGNNGNGNCSEDDRITTSTASGMEIMTDDIDDDGEQEVDFDSFHQQTASQTSSQSSESEISPLFSPSRRKPISRKKGSQATRRQKSSTRTLPFISFKTSSLSKTGIHTGSLTSISSSMGTGDVLDILSMSNTTSDSTRKRKREEEEEEEDSSTQNTENDEPQAKKQAAATELERQKTLEAQAKSRNWLQERTKQKQKVLSSVFGKKQGARASNALQKAMNVSAQEKEDDDDESDEEFAHISIS